MVVRFAVALAFALGCAGGVTFAGAESGPLGSWLDRPYLTGDWGGWRTKLFEMGIRPELSLVSDIQGNPVGGERQAIRSFSNLGLSVTLDLEKLGGWSGASVHLSASWRFGSSLTEQDIGNVFDVANVCCGAAFRVVDVAYQQSVLDSRLDFRVGRIAAGDDFLASPLYGYFVQSSINGNPAGSVFNVPLSSYPTSTWGLRVRGRPIDEISMMAGEYNGDPALGANDKHGADWSMRGPLFAIAELGYLHHQGKNALGLPGNYKLGAFYHDGKYADLFRDVSGGSYVASGLPRRVHQGQAGIYVLADQMVYRAGPQGSAQGLTPFVSVVVAPDTNISVMPFFVNGGLVYRGLVPARVDDIAAFGVSYGRFSAEQQRAQRAERRVSASTAGVQEHELVLEWSYIMQAAKWLGIQPDLQYIVNPGGTGKVKNAVVIGLQMAVTF